MRMRRVAAFTLLDMVVAVALLGILAMTAIPSILTSLTRKQVEEALPLAALAQQPVALSWAVTQQFPADNAAAGLVFTPHLVPMTRGILATIYARGRATTAQCLDAARRFYNGRAFVRVTDAPPQTKWATGSNLAFVSYAADPARNLVMALGVVDNLGKGAAGQAVQNANLICGLPENAGLEGAPVWP